MPSLKLSLDSADWITLNATLSPALRLRVPEPSPAVPAPIFPAPIADTLRGAYAALRGLPDLGIPPATPHAAGIIRERIAAVCLGAR